MVPAWPASFVTAVSPRLRANGPYDLALSLRRIVCPVVAKRHPQLATRDEPLQGGEFPVTLRLDGVPVLVGLRQEDDQAIQAHVRAGVVAADRRALLTEALRRMLGLEVDLAAFYRQVRGDRPMQRLTRRYHGLRPVLSPTPFEGLVHAIGFQQISYTAARTVELRLMERWGDAIPYQDRSYLVYPTPDRLAGLDPAALRTIGFSPRKAQAILQVARDVVQGQLDLGALSRTTDAEAVARRLRQIPGIGPWTAHQAIIRGLGLSDCLPLEDPGLRRAVETHYRLVSPSSEGQIHEVGDKWRPWRSYGSYYLWNTFWESSRFE